MALALAACGGGGDDGAAAPTTPDTDNTPTSTTSADTDSGSEDGDGGSTSGHRASVTIGDLTYDLHSGGIFWGCMHSNTLIAGNYAVDPSGTPVAPGNPDIGVQINYVILSQDSGDPQSPFITVQDTAAGTQWQTGEFADVPEATFVDWTLEDGVGTGTAVFFDLASYLNGNPAELVEGSFEIVCDF